MTTEDALRIAALVLGTFGGGALIVFGLAKWLGGVWTGRILQNERAALDEKLEAIRHELGIAKSSYEHHLDLILAYYATFYRHYRLCQRAAFADAHQTPPDGPIVHTKDEFIEALELFISEWAAQEGRIRLLLPAKLLAIHEEAVTKFNEFKRAVHSFTPAEPSPRKKEVVFREIEDVKVRLESGLRDFLRTESLLK